MPEAAEIQIARLDERFRSLEKKVDAGNVEILSQIKDLKENLASRLQQVEITKLAASDFITWRTSTAQILDDHEKRVREVETIVNQSRGGFYIATALVGVLSAGAATIITAYIINKL